MEEQLLKAHHVAFLSYTITSAMTDALMKIMSNHGVQSKQCITFGPNFGATVRSITPQLQACQGMESTAAMPFQIANQVKLLSQEVEQPQMVHHVVSHSPTNMRHTMIAQL